MLFITGTNTFFWRIKAPPRYHLNGREGGTAAVPGGGRPPGHPVILSLEVHCGMKQQASMARLMREILGDCIKVPSFPFTSSNRCWF